MKQIRICPKEYISERFVMDYFGYSFEEAINMYLEKFKSFTRDDIRVE